ncbi:MAG: BamA/TamA family outer membrane protein [Bacteroidia bacterium]|nr:BamA/TamA family outer membrane protein [Bacteroidia bacterium]
MRRAGAVIASLILCLGAVTLQAQDLSEDTPLGWKAIPLPILSFNSDLGFQFGATTDIYDYGREPSVFPEYLHKFHVEASHYTKGQTLAHIEYDSSHLVDAVRISASLTAQIDPLYNFYGFNGISPYDRNVDRNDGVAYYNYKRSLFRFQSNFLGDITPNIHWVTGLSFSYYVNEELNFSGYDSSNTLYHFLRERGVIRDDERKGGFFEFKGGMSFDTRDFEPSPSKGIWGELYLVGAPDILGTGYSYLKFSAHFRHYITPGPDWLTLAYHLAYQGTILGEAPFYMQPNIYSLLFKQAYSEGLGGLNTVRGILSGRLVGNDYAWANFEIRCRVISGLLLGREWYIAVNPFFDMGFITRPYRLSELATALDESEAEIDRKARALHKSAGLGLKFGFDRNYIMSVEGGKSFSNDDGPFSIAIAINYIF